MARSKTPDPRAGRVRPAAPAGRGARLDPVRRWRLPRPGTMLRISIVTALLLTSAAVLYSGDWGNPGPAPAPATSLAPSAPVASPDGPRSARLSIPEGMVGVPVALGTPAALAMIHPGDRIDLLLITDGAEPVPLATDVPVLAVAPADAVLFLALRPSEARQVVSQQPASGARFAVIVRR